MISKNLGLAVDALDEAVDVVAFSELIRAGYLVKEILTDAVYKGLNDEWKAYYGGKIWV